MRWVRPGEAFEIGAARAAELVDRLVVVGDHQQVAVVRNQGLHEPRLGEVGVLVLIDHDVVDPPGDGAAHSRLLANEPFRVEDAVVVIEDTVAAVTLVEKLVHGGDLPVALDDHAFCRIAARVQPVQRPGRVGVRRHELLLRVSNHRQERVH